jgi:hypothetical protein
MRGPVLLADVGLDLDDPADPLAPPIIPNEEGAD